MPVNSTLPRGRKRLAPPWMIASVGAVMIVLLYFLFPRSSLFGQLGQGDADTQADSLRVLLLRNLMLKGEAGIELRKDYIRQLGLTGDYAGAFAELDRLLPAAAGRPLDSLRMLQIEVAVRALAADSADSLARSRLKSGLQAMTGPETEPGALAWAAVKAEAASEYELAKRLYAGLGGRGGEKASQWYREAARLAASLGNCREASDLHFLSQDRAAGEADKRNAFMDALRSLEACQQMDLAVRQAEAHLGGLRSDSKTLLFVVNLARSANRPRVAEKYALMLVRPVAATAGAR
jgi:hypothetical protein